MRPLQVFVIQISSSTNQEIQDDSISEKFENARDYTDRLDQIIVQIHNLCRGLDVNKSQNYWLCNVGYRAPEIVGIAAGKVSCIQTRALVHQHEPDPFDLENKPLETDGDQSETHRLQGTDQSIH